MHAPAGLPTWSQRLWQEITPIYEAILVHPFVTGLTSGHLDEDVFGAYVAQDVHYLRSYARALAILAGKAPTLADTATFARHAAEVQDVELQLHQELLPALGIDADRLAEVPPAPTTVAYTSYLLATAYGAGFADGVAAVLPCYWIYARVGEQLLERGSTNPRYQLWIDSYGSPEYAATVAEVLTLTDRLGARIGAAEEASARAHFVHTARYEWMFFDAAYQRERWPL